MKTLALGALCIGFALAACGGGDDGGNNNDSDNNDSDVVSDNNDNNDSMPIDGEDPVTCDPLAQTGCNANERCTWIWDSLDNPTTTETVEPQVGHLGCASDSTGTIAVNGQCVRSGPDFGEDSMGTGASTADNCVKGSYCIASICKSICDHQGGDPKCTGDFACNRYSGIFVSMGATIAGVCDAKCNPLTQKTNGTSLEACNSTDAMAPNQGCYVTAGTGTNGLGFSCARVPADSKGRTDRMAAYGPASGGVYSNGCEAGYIPAYPDGDDDTVTNCTGTCAPKDSDNSTQATKDAHLGDTLGVAKLVDKAAAATGDGLCTQTKKGSSGGGEDCRYIWPSNHDDMNVIFEDNPYNNTVGLCYPFGDYTYDNDGDTTTPEIGEPSCQDLPIETGDATTTVHGIFAWELGCYSRTRTKPIEDAQPKHATSTGHHLPRRLRVMTHTGQTAYRHILL